MLREGEHKRKRLSRTHPHEHHRSLLQDTVRRTDAGNLKGELSPETQWCLRPGWPLPLLTRLPTATRVGAWLHFPWPGPLLERAVSSLAVDAGAGRIQATCKTQKHFPLHNRFQTSLDKQRGWRQELGPQMAGCGPTPLRHQAFLSGIASQGRGSSGVNDGLEVKTPQKLQSNSKALQGENS